jgi:DNA-binding NarL/FixJ family response regulator
VRIVIGEDAALFREGLARLLDDAGHEIVGKADDATSLVATVEETRPDLAIIDIRMPPDRTDDGARAARGLRVRHPTLGIVLLSQHLETRHSVELAALGYFGYLLKDRVFDVDDFLDALRRVAAGGSALDPEVVARLITPVRRDDPLAALTPREREVLALMAEGRTNLGIARRLWLTGRTVETHVSSVMAKLGLADTAEDHRRVLAVLTWLAGPPEPDLFHDRGRLLLLAFRSCADVPPDPRLLPAFPVRARFVHVKALSAPAGRIAVRSVRQDRRLGTRVQFRRTPLRGNYPGSAKIAPILQLWLPICHLDPASRQP